MVEALDDYAKDLILNVNITDKNKQCQDQLPELYNPFLDTPLSIILDTLITPRENWYRLIKTSREEIGTEKYNILSSFKPL